MRRSLAWALLALAACHRSSSPVENFPIPSDAGVVESNISLSDTATPIAFDGGHASKPPLDDAFAHALPAHGKSIGHTSIVFKLGLVGGLDAAYKPRSHRGGERFRGEIAAYRLAVALGIDNVPPAFPRSFPADAVRAALDEQASALFAQEVVIEPDGTVRGAIIPWISHLAFLPLETPESRAKWEAWIEAPDTSEFAPPSAASPGGACDKSLAGQISTMIAFDVMTGNWDRWSGGNIGNAQGGGCIRVLYIDNDGAFFDPPPAAPLAANVALLQKIQLFSRSFVTKLRAASDADLERAFGEELPGKPLLSRRVIDAFLARRKIVLAAIDQKIKARGEDATLAFP